MYKNLVLIIGAYFLGSIPFSYLIAKWTKGIDLRKFGDGNVGASNVSKAAGRRAGTAAFLCDVIKGMFPVYLARILNFPEYVAVLAGLCAISGHNWPVFLKFKGGKGLSTTIGVTGTLVSIEGAILLIPFFLVYRRLKHGAFAIMVVGPFLPIICWFRGRSVWIIGGTIAILAFVFLGAVKHVKKILSEIKLKKPGSEP